MPLSDLRVLCGFINGWGAESLSCETFTKILGVESVKNQHEKRENNTHSRCPTGAPDCTQGSFVAPGFVASRAGIHPNSLAGSHGVARFHDSKPIQTKSTLRCPAVCALPGQSADSEEDEDEKVGDEKEDDFIQNRTRGETPTEVTSTLAQCRLEEEFITSVNWRGKHNSLSRGAWPGHSAFRFGLSAFRKGLHAIKRLKPRTLLWRR